MFNKTIIHPKEYVPYEKSTHNKTNVTINRQSTADDARLLHDLETKAREKIEQTIVTQLTDNKIEVAYVDYRMSATDCAKIVKAIFLVNGHKHTLDIKVNEDRYVSEREVVMHMANQITNEIMQLLMAQMPSAGAKRR